MCQEVCERRCKGLEPEPTSRSGVSLSLLSKWLPCLCGVERGEKFQSHKTTSDSGVYLVPHPDELDEVCPSPGRGLREKILLPLFYHCLTLPFLPSSILFNLSVGGSNLILEPHPGPRSVHIQLHPIIGEGSLDVSITL